MDYFEPLDLDPATVETTAAVHTGYGWALLIEGIQAYGLKRNSQDRKRSELVERSWSLAASSLTIGASCYSLLYPHIAELVFWHAGRVYLELGLAYGAVLSVCARDDKSIRSYWGRFMESSNNDARISDILPRLLLAAYLGATEPKHSQEYLHRVISQAGAFEGATVGSSRIPLRYYVDLAKAATSGKQLAEPQVIQSLLYRAAEEGAGARVDRYHWKKILTRSLPVEPDLLAASMVFTEAHKNNIGKYDFDEGSVASIPLDVAKRIVSEPSGVVSEGELRVAEKVTVLRAMLTSRSKGDWPAREQ